MVEDQADKDLDKDKDFTNSYLLQVAAKPTIAIKQQQWTQSESSQHMTVKRITLNNWITISTIECVLHAKLRNRTCQGLDQQGQGQGLTSLVWAALVLNH